MKKAVLLIAIIFFASCGGKKTMTTQTNFEKQTEREHIVSYIDTVFITPKSISKLTIPVSAKPLIGAINYESKSNNAKAEVRITKDTIYVTATCDTIALQAQIKKELLKEFSQSSAESNSNIKKQTGIPLLNVIFYLLISAAMGYLIKTFNII